MNEITNHIMTVREYGHQSNRYNIHFAFDRDGEHYEYWAIRSGSLFNRAMAQQWIWRNLREYPGIAVVQDLCGSYPFDITIGVYVEEAVR